MKETLIYPGEALKTLDGNGKVGGYLVKFGSRDERDFDKQFFTKNCFYGHNNGDGAVLLVHHGIPLTSGLKGYDEAKVEALNRLSERIMGPIKTTVDEVGIFAEAVLNLADAYEKKVYEFVEQQKLRWSSGSATHMVKIADDGEILRWPIVEGSLTPTACNFRSVALPLKSYLDLQTQSVKAMYLHQRLDQVRQAFHSQYPTDVIHSWVVDVSDEEGDRHVIAEIGGSYFQIPFSDSEDSILFEGRDTWREVEQKRTWEAKKSLYIKNLKTQLAGFPEASSPETDSATVTAPKDATDDAGGNAETVSANKGAILLLDSLKDLNQTLTLLS